MADEKLTDEVIEGYDLVEPNEPEEAVPAQEDPDPVDDIDNPDPEPEKDEDPDGKGDEVDEQDELYELDESYQFRYGEETLSAKDLLEAHKQKSSFEKKMTQDLQKLAKDKGDLKNTVAWGKSLKALRDKLSEDSELFEKVKTTVSESGGEDAVAALEALVGTDIDSVVDPYLEEKNKLQGDLENIELEKAWEEKKSNLASAHNLTKDQVEAVENACIDAKQDGEFVDLEHMYFKMINDGRLIKDKPKEDPTPKSAGKRKPKVLPKVKTNVTDSSTRKPKPKTDPLSTDATDEEVAKYGESMFSGD